MARAFASRGCALLVRLGALTPGLLERGLAFASHQRAHPAWVAAHFGPTISLRALHTYIYLCIHKYKYTGVFVQQYRKRASWKKERHQARGPMVSWPATPPRRCERQFSVYMHSSLRPNGNDSFNQHRKQNFSWTIINNTSHKYEWVESLLESWSINRSTDRLIDKSYLIGLHSISWELQLNYNVDQMINSCPQFCMGFAFPEWKLVFQEKLDRGPIFFFIVYRAILIREFLTIVDREDLSIITTCEIMDKSNKVSRGSICKMQEATQCSNE